MGGEDKELSDLLEKSRKLPTEDTDTLQKPLTNLWEKSRSLSTKKAYGEAPMSKVSLMFSTKGFNVENYNRSFQTINLKAAFEPLTLLEGTDIEGYLKHERSMIVLTAIEEAKKTTLSNFEENYWNSMDSDWKQAKKELEQSLGIRKDPRVSTVSGASTSFLSTSALSRGSTTPRSSVSRYRPHTPSASIRSTPGGRGATSMDERMQQYARIVYDLNLSRKQGEFYPIVQGFLSAADVINDPASQKKDIIENWTLLMHLVDEEGIEEKGINIIKESMSEDKRKHEFLERAKGFLETQYAEYVVDTVSRCWNIDPSSVSTIELISAFLQLKVGNSDGVGIDYETGELSVWGIIYYCLRCGLREDALEFAESSQHFVGEAVLISLRSIARNQPTPHRTMEQLNTEYKTGVRNHNDLFKQAVYLILGSCDVEKSIPEVFERAEDFMWLKLSIVDESFYPLERLQEFLLEYKNNMRPMLFCKLLLLTQQFEEAVGYLCSDEADGFQVEAVHFAITLHYYGLVQLASDSKAPLVAVENDRKVLNFHFLINDYVRMFAHTDLRDAVSYIYLIEDQEVMENFLVQLVLDSRDVPTLLGTPQKKGCIEEFLSPGNASHVLHGAADRFEQQGNVTSAIELYFVAESRQRRNADYGRGYLDQSEGTLQKILILINEELSMVLMKGDQRQEVIELASNVRHNFETLKLYSKLSDPKQYETFNILCDLITFFDLVWRGQDSEALEVIERLGLVAFDPSTREARQEAFQFMDDTIKRNFADILLASMSVLRNLYQRYQTEGSRQPHYVLQEIKEKAKGLQTFAGFIENRLPSDVFKKLVRMSFV
eukprot:gb/GECH01014772.1/.p1 GENE.gb/GECH01014772.1/~~gb/GECH01014772.1/.p1  ORF type:complete len:831 (+),score=193.89 gb/GECH01014772.1/:1-2493(+)